MTKKMDNAETKEYVTKHIANSEKIVESAIELNAACFQASEAMGKKLYENYVSNVAAAFDGIKALNKTNDIAEFYKVCSSNIAASTERDTEQTKSVAELSGKIMKETGEACRLAYSKSFAINF